MSEEEIRINIDNSETKSEDTYREEEKWSEKNEKFLKDIKLDCLHRSSQHDIISHRNKKRYVYTSIPTMVIPLILANVTIVNQEYSFLEPIGLTFVSMISVFQTLLNFSKRSEIHNTYSGKYSDLSNQIDKILIRRKKYRNAFDVCLEKITSRKQNLDNSAPYV